MNEMRKACRTCPWKKGTTSPGLIGGSEPTVYIGQVSGPFYFPCHSSKGYAGKKTNLESSDTKQCAGANIFRANIDVAKLMPKGIEQLSQDLENIYNTREEFLAHYYNVSEEVIKTIFTERLYQELLIKEMSDTKVKKVNLKK
jgi:hypothetical protein